MACSGMAGARQGDEMRRRLSTQVLGRRYERCVNENEEGGGGGGGGGEGGVLFNDWAAERSPGSRRAVWAKILLL